MRDSIDLSLTSMNALLLTSSIYYKELSKLFTVNRYVKTVGNNEFADRLRSEGDIIYKTIEIVRALSLDNRRV